MTGSGQEAGDDVAVRIERPDGRGPFVLLCDHASNRIPRRLGTLGLDPADLDKHFAWDPGALGMARALSARLDAVLVASTVSRLVIDCNRDPSEPDSIVAVGETTPVPGNQALDPEERVRRVAEAYAPYHDAVERVVGPRRAAGRPTALVAVHSFNPTMRGTSRPWHVGVLHDADMRLAAPLIAGLAADPGLVVGDNAPYSPADRVYHTLERHGGRFGLPTVMLEIRNDLIADAAGEAAWAERLAPLLAAAWRGTFDRREDGPEAAAPMGRAVVERRR